MDDTGFEPSCQSPINHEGSAHSDSGRGAQSDVTDPLAAFVAVLTPEQRAALAKLLAGAT